MGKLIAGLSQGSPVAVSSLEDTKTKLELEIDRKLATQQNSLEDGIRKQLNRDMQRINGEVLNLNTILTKLTVENRSLEEKLLMNFENKMALWEKMYQTKVKELSALKPKEVDVEEMLARKLG